MNRLFSKHLNMETKYGDTNLRVSTRDRVRLLLCCLENQVIASGTVPSNLKEVVACR